MRKEGVISMVYIMTMAGAMCWVIAHDRPDKALCIILLLHICVVLIMTLRWLGEMMNVHMEVKGNREERMSADEGKT